MCIEENGHTGSQAQHIRGVFPEHAVYTEEGAAWLLNCDGTRTPIDRIIYGENDHTKTADGEFEGVAHVKAGNHFLFHGSDLGKWVLKHARVRRRPQKQGGKQKKCPEKPPR